MTGHLLASAPAEAAAHFDLTKIDTGATAWVLASAALVLLMTPGLAFFYGGMVRGKNVLGMLMQNFATIAIVSIVWVVVSFSLAFGGGGSFVGNLHFAGLQHMTEVLPGYTDAAAQVIPPMAFVVFQLMFAVITPALITGSTADRWRFGAFVPFVVAWSILVYGPVAHWVFSPEGWLFKRGALDFAGGTVVHISSGVSALVAALVLGRRIGFGKQKAEPHDATMTVLGAALLWFGWFGFNAGSALGAGALATSAFVVTNTATAMAALTWMTVSWWHKKQPSVIGAAAGAVAGLVAITPASGFVNVMGAIVIGFGAGVVCYLAIQLRERIHVDDALDVWAVHGIGGTWGALATGLFATVAINSAAANGLFYGNPKQVLIQLLAIGAAWGWSIVGTFVILKVVNRFVPLRVEEDEELLGLDLSQHGEPAYASISAN